MNLRFPKSIFKIILYILESWQFEVTVDLQASIQTQLILTLSYGHS